MPASQTISLNLPQKYLEQVQALLRNPQNPLEETGALYDLNEAFIESNLPIRVDIMDLGAHSGKFSPRDRAGACGGAGRAQVKRLTAEEKADAAANCDRLCAVERKMMRLIIERAL